MFYILNSSPPFVGFGKFTALCAAMALFGIWLSASTVQAGGPYPWSDQPEYQRTPGDYSQGSDQSYQLNRREEFDRQAERYRQESYRQEQELRNAAPARPPSYQEQYWIQKDGKSTLCVPQHNPQIVTCYNN